MKRGAFYRKRLSSLVILLPVFLVLVSSLVPAQTTTSATTEVFGGESQPAPQEKYLKEQYRYEKKFESHADFGPTFEGYSREQQILAQAFKYIGDEFGEGDAKLFCENPERMADLVLEKLKAKIGDVSNACAGLGDSSNECLEKKGEECSRIGTPLFPEKASELQKKAALANSCPPNEAFLIEACKESSIEYMKTRLEFLDEVCEDQWRAQGEFLAKECGRQSTFATCDRDGYLKQCLGNFGVRQGEIKEVPKEAERPATACPTFQAPGYCNGVLESQYDSNKCLVGYTCKPSPVEQVCTAEYSPVCGKDGRTYSNKCFASLAKVEINYGGECKVTCPQVTAKACASGEMSQAAYDDKGCVISYSCVAVRQETVVTQTSTETTPTQTTTTDMTTATTGTTAETKTTTETSQITGGAVLTTYEDYARQCEKNWASQESYCKQVSRNCDKSSYIEQCKAQERQNFENFKQQSTTQCRINSRVQLKYLNDNCAGLDEEKARCKERAAEYCSQSSLSAEQCGAVMTEENLRQFLVEEAKKRCKFVGYGFYEKEEEVRQAAKAEVVVAVLNSATEADLEDLGKIVEDLDELLTLPDVTVFKGVISPPDFGQLKLLPFVSNAKLLSFESSETSEAVKTGIVSAEQPRRIAERLTALRGTEIPRVYVYIIEDKASDIVNVSDALQAFEENEGEKGFGYKFRRFLGLARQAEEQEAAQLEASLGKLDDSIAALTKLIDQVPDNISKAVLKEQVDALQQQRDALKELIGNKRNSARGLLGIFG